MAVLKCKMCGGDIIALEGQTYGTCDSCGSTVTLPNVNDQRMENLFNRANHFRMVSEFDKAVATYEMILNEDNSNAEAHWGLLLSRYGIEYVEDPTSHERIPTCHRIQNDPILTDDDYLAAIQHAPDGYTRSLYESEGKRLSELQRGLLQVSAQTEPFDIFICYKETTEGGSRTNDSALAQDIYYQLINAGYKVFFSRVTLESMLGQQYEPHIFAALNSAKVMLAIGTKPEYFNAVWVKNEWSRFLALSRKDRSKVLIPCYRDMNVYDLPDELSMLQSQDMGKIGFIQDLLRGIEKVIRGQKKEKQQAAPMVVAPGVESLHKRAMLFLEDGDFSSATDYANRILDVDPQYAPAYIVKVQASLGIRHERDLAKHVQPLNLNTDYQKAVRFADAAHKKVYEQYNQAIEDRLAAEELERIYTEANTAMENALTEADYASIADTFDSISEYRDSALLAEECRECAAKKRAALDRRNALKKKILCITVPTMIFTIVAVIVFFTVIEPAMIYRSAQTALKDQRFDEAIEIFISLEDYKDASEMIIECRYQKASDYLSKGEFPSAISMFVSLGNYKDTESILINAKTSAYQTAEKHFNTGSFSEALPLYAAVADLNDSYAKCIECGRYADDAALIDTIHYLISREDYSENDYLEIEFAYGGVPKDLYQEILGLYLEGTWVTTDYTTVKLSRYNNESVTQPATEINVTYSTGEVTLCGEPILLDFRKWDSSYVRSRNVYEAYGALVYDGDLHASYKNDYNEDVEMCVYLNEGKVTMSREEGSSFWDRTSNFKLTMVKKDTQDTTTYPSFSGMDPWAVATEAPVYTPEPSACPTVVPTQVPNA